MANNVALPGSSGWAALQIAKLTRELRQAKSEIRSASARNLDLTLRNQDLETRLARAYRSGEAKKVRLAPAGRRDRVNGDAALERDPSRGA